MTTKRKKKKKKTRTGKCFKSFVLLGNNLLSDTSQNLINE